MRVGVAQKAGDIVLLARVERAGDDFAAAGFDVGDERREFLSVAPAGKNREAFGGELFRDRGADEIPGPDYRRGGIALGQNVLP